MIAKAIMRACIVSIALLLAILLALAVPRVFAAGEDAGKQESTAKLEAELDTAPVELDYRVLFRVRGMTSFPAEERAARIRKRIQAAAADPTFQSAALRLEPTDNAVMIMAGDKPLMMVTDWDAKLELVDRQYLAKTLLDRIRQAIDDYRSSRTADSLLRSGLYAAVATVILIILGALLVPLGRRLDRLLSERVKERIHDVGIESFEIFRAENIWKALHFAVYALRVAIIAVLFIGYLHFVLSLFPWTRGLFGRLLGLDADALAKLGKAFLAWLPDLIVLFIIFFLFRFVLRLLRTFFDAVRIKRVTLSGFDAEWATPTYKMARFVLLAFAVVIAYPYLPGSESAAFKGITVFIGLVFSLGSSAAVSNIIAGYLIFYRRVFRGGDRVKVGEVIGNVLAIKLQVTHLLSLKNEEITIPNSQILSGNVTNYSSLARKQGLILHTEVGIGYETPWRQVEAMLLEAARRTSGLMKEPSPYVLIKRLGDFAVVYEINIFCDSPDGMELHYTALHRHIIDVFNEYGVQIMTPAYIADTPEPKLVPREQWYAAPASPAAQATAGPQPGAPLEEEGAE